VTETTAAATTTAKKAAEKTAAVVVDTLPTVVETVEVAMEVPAKVVLNQKLVVVVSLAAGSALTAGVLYGLQKWRAHKADKENQVEVPNDLSKLDEANKN
jgi:hypothetical protein